jgi:MFS family permease
MEMSGTAVSTVDTASGDPTTRESEGYFTWYTELPSQSRKSFWACFGGWALDTMDLQLYSFMIPTLMSIWTMNRGEAGSIVTVALLSSSVGGWLAGILADRFGRVRILQLTVLWFSAFTCLSAFTGSYGELLVVRALHGLGFGGEWAVGAALIGEIIRDKYRGTAAGTVHSAWGFGAGAAALLYAIFYSVLPETIAWRALFIFGAIPAVFVIFIRRYVSDSPIFLEQQKKYVEGMERSSFLEIFAPASLPYTLLGALLSTGILGGGYAIQAWLPTFLKTVRHLSVLDTSAFVAVNAISHVMGYVAGAYLADILGRRWNFVLFAAVSSISVLLYMVLPVSNTLMLFLGFPLGFGSAAVYSGIGAVLAEIFPTRIRGSGIGFCFNFGRAMGAIFPMMIGFLSAHLPLGEAIGIFAVGAYGVVVIAALLLPETKGKSLTETDGMVPVSSQLSSTKTSESYSG